MKRPDLHNGSGEYASCGIPLVLLREGYPSRPSEILQTRNRIPPHLFEFIYIQTGTDRRNPLAEVFFGFLKYPDRVHNPFFGGIPRWDDEQSAHLPYSFFKVSRRERPDLFFACFHGKSLPSAL